MSISLITPFKNAAPFLEECIASVLKQDFTDWEWILVDDGSTDTSKEIVLGAKDPRFQLLPNEGVGILPALQTAQKHITGNFVSRMDADDIMPPKKLSTLLDCLKQHGKGYVATGKVKYFGVEPVSAGYLEYEAWLNERIEKQDHYKHLYRECVVASPNWMMFREDFDKTEGYNNLSYPEDYDQIFRWEMHGLKIACTSDITHLWREHSKRTSRNSPHYQQKAFFQLKTHHFLKNHNNPSICLVGAKKKGKLIASLLQERKVPFRWVETKPSIIGQKIMNTFIEDLSQLEKSDSVILSIYPANKEREKLELLLLKKGYEIGDNVWYF